MLKTKKNKNKKKENFQEGQDLFIHKTKFINLIRDTSFDHFISQHAKLMRLTALGNNNANDCYKKKYKKLKMKKFSYRISINQPTM